jgi:hypothetical protein
MVIVGGLAVFVFKIGFSLSSHWSGGEATNGTIFGINILFDFHFPNARILRGSSVGCANHTDKHMESSKFEVPLHQR